MSYPTLIFLQTKIASSMINTLLCSYTGTTFLISIMEFLFFILSRLLVEWLVYNLRKSLEGLL